MSASSLLPEDVLTLVIRAYVEPVSDECHLCTYSSLRLVNSFFNDSVLHEIFSLGSPLERPTHGIHDRILHRPTRSDNFVSQFVAVRYLQGSLIGIPNRQPPDDLSKPFFASIPNAVESLRELLLAHGFNETALFRSIQHEEKLGHRSNARSLFSCRLGSRSPVFRDIPNLLVCCAVTRFCQPELVFKAIVGSGYRRSDKEQLQKVASLGTDFWLFFTTCLIGDVGLAQQTLPLALENAGSHQTLDITDELFLSCLNALVEEDVPQVFRFLLDSGIDTRISEIELRTPSILDDVVGKGQTELLSILLDFVYGSQKSGEDYEEAVLEAVSRVDYEVPVLQAAKFEDVAIRHIMVDTLLSTGQKVLVDDANIRQKVLAEACLRNDLYLARRMLDEDSNAAIYERHIDPDIVCNLGLQRTKDVSLQVEMIRLVYSSIHKFAPMDMSIDKFYSGNMLSAEWTALHCTADFEVFQELLLHVRHLSPGQRFLLASEKEGGIAALERHDPIIDLRLESDDPAMNHYNAPSHFTVGMDALSRAVSYGCIDNVEILLDRGVEFVGRSQLFVGWALKEPEKFTALQDLFKKEGTPRVEIRTTRSDPRTYRHPRESVV